MEDLYNFKRTLNNKQKQQDRQRDFEYEKNRQIEILKNKRAADFEKMK